MIMRILDALYAPFKIKESDFSQKNLMWMKIFSIVATPGPIAYFLLMRFMEDFIEAPVVLALILIPIVAMSVCLLQRPVSYLTRTDKNLDEWERGLKYRSESFAYRFIFYSSLVLSGLWFLLGIMHPNLTLTVSLLDVGLVFITFVMAMTLIISNYLAWTVVPITEDYDEEVMMGREKKVKDTILIVALIICVLAFVPALFAFGWISAHHAAGHEGLF